MRKSVNIAILGVFALATTGCGWFGGDDEPQSLSGCVAVVDLDAVAKQLGRDVQMANSLKEQQSSLTEQLKTAQASFVKQINEKKAEFEKPAEGETPGQFNEGQVELASATEELSDEERKELLGLTQKANLLLNQERRKASSFLGQQRAKLVGSFREEVKPIALEIAKAKGLTIVATKNDSVIFSYDGAVDITSEVVKRMKSGG